MLTELTDYIRRHGLTVAAFIKQQKMHSYKRIIEYCRTRELQPITEEEFSVALKNSGLMAEKAAPKVTKNVVRKTKTKATTTKRKTTRSRKAPTETP